MPKIFRPSTRESSLLSKIESSREHARKMALQGVRDHIDQMSNSVASKLIENDLVETTNKNGLEEQIHQSLSKLGKMDDFDIDYQVAPFRNLVPNPNIVSLYLTSYVIESLIKSKDIVDIFGSDEDIYFCIHSQVKKYLP